MDWKKILIALGLIIVGIILYFISPFLSKNLAASLLLLGLFIIAHIVLSIFYVRKNYSKKILIAIIILLLINVTIIKVNFPVCDTSHKNGPSTSCDCLGIKKEGLFMSECIGIRTNCYRYNQSIINTWDDLENLGEIRSEISCDEIRWR